MSPEVSAPKQHSGPTACQPSACAGGPPQLRRDAIRGGDGVSGRAGFRGRRLLRARPGLCVGGRARVAGIGFDDQRYQARVSLDLDSRYHFPKDSSLKILTSGLLGEQYIGVEPGADDKNLASGDNVTQTQSAVVLENLISQFLYNSAAGNSPAGGKGASADK